MSLSADCVLAGICIGLNAALIAILTEWLSDLKMGYCTDGWWLNQEFCCWEIETDGEGACAAWKPWTKYAAGMWFIYTTIAVSMPRYRSVFLNDKQKCSFRVILSRYSPTLLHT